MGKNLDTFKKDLTEIQSFLSTRKKLNELAVLAGVGLTTVNDTFKVKNFDELVGKRLDVYQKAIEMVNQIKSLPQQANEAIK